QREIIRISETQRRRLTKRREPVHLQQHRPHQALVPSSCNRANNAPTRSSDPPLSAQNAANNSPGARSPPAEPVDTAPPATTTAPCSSLAPKSTATGEPE